MLIYDFGLVLFTTNSHKYNWFQIVLYFVVVLVFLCLFVALVLVGVAGVVVNGNSRCVVCTLNF